MRPLGAEAAGSSSHWEACWGPRDAAAHGRPLAVLTVEKFCAKSAPSATGPSGSQPAPAPVRRVRKELYRLAGPRQQLSCHHRACAEADLYVSPACSRSPGEERPSARPGH